MGVVYVALTLALQGEIRISRGELGGTRVWLLQEGGERGLGFSGTRLVSGSEASGSACVETRVRFLMLNGNGESAPVSYCECLQKVGATWTSTSTGECLPPSSGGD